MTLEKEDISCILDEDCVDCKLAAGTGQLLSICNSLHYKDCEKMHKAILDETLNPGELMEIMLERTRNMPDKKEIVEEIIDLMLS